MRPAQRRPTPRSTCCAGIGATHREQRKARIPVLSETSVQHGLVGNLADDEGHAAGLVGKLRHVDPCRPVRVVTALPQIAYLTHQVHCIATKESSLAGAVRGGTLRPH